MSENSSATIASTITSVGISTNRREGAPSARGRGVGGGMRTVPIAAAAATTSRPPATNEKRHVSAVAASAPTSSGVTIPPRLTDTSPSVIATVRRSPCASASAAHIRTSAEVPNRLTRNAENTVTSTLPP